MGIALSPRLLTRVLRSLATLSKRLGGICGRAADPGSVHGDQTHTELVERLTTDGHQPPLAAPGDEERRSAVGWTILGVGKDATVRKRDLALHPRGGVEAQHSDDATDARCRGGAVRACAGSIRPCVSAISASAPEPGSGKTAPLADQAGVWLC